jgi:hypothetical protein
VGEPENQVINYAINNGGIVTRDEALAMGMSARTISRRLASARLIGIAPGVLALPGVIHSERGLLLAAASAIGAVVSHQSAARLHGLDILDERTVSVTVPIRRTNRFHSVVIHESTDLEAVETTYVDGLPVTDPPRTLIDLASIVRRRQLADLVDQAVRMRLTTYDLVGVRLERLARRGKPGVVKLRGVLEARLDLAMEPDSTLEMRVVRVLLGGGLPLPTTQFRPPWLRHSNGRVDLAYIDNRVIVEADGRRWHNSPEAFQLDRQRDNLAQLAGWIILRFTWDDIVKRPSYVIATVRDALNRTSRA